MHHSEANLVWNPRVVILIKILVPMATEWFADKLAYFVKNNDFSTNFAGNASSSEMAASHFLQVQVKSQVISLQVQVKSQVISLQVQVKSQVIWSDVKSSHKSFGPNTSQVTSLFVQVQVKSHNILSSCKTQSGPGIKSIYSELQSKIYEMVNSI